jgi:hypothetical protein
VYGEFPIFAAEPAAVPVHVRFMMEPAVCPAHVRVTLLFKLSIAVKDVGGRGATAVDAIALYVVSPQRVAPTWKE